MSKKGAIARTAQVQKDEGMERLRGNERQGILEILTAYQIVKEAEGKVDKRIGKIKRGRWRAHVALAMLDTLSNELVRTVPVDQLVNLKHDMEHATFKIGMYRPLDTRNEFGIWLSYADAETLFNGLNDHCLVCDLDRAGQAKCRIRKMMNSIPNEAVDIRDNGQSCPYYSIV